MQGICTQLHICTSFIGALIAAGSCFKADEKSARGEEQQEKRRQGKKSSFSCSSNAFRADGKTEIRIVPVRLCASRADVQILRYSCAFNAILHIKGRERQHSVLFGSDEPLRAHPSGEEIRQFVEISTREVLF